MFKKSLQWITFSLFNNKSINGFFEPLIQKFLVGFKFNKYRSKVLAVRNENKDVYTLVLRLSSLWKGFKAGQFIELIVEKKGVRTSRYFSISSNPTLFKEKNIIELTIQKQLKGNITPWLYDNLKQGQYISVSNALGDFCVQDMSKPMLLIAAGTGITPLKSIIMNNRNSNIHLIYYARNSKHLFKEELKQFTKQHSKTTITLIDSTQKGRFCDSHLNKICPDFLDRDTYICGPGSMIESAKNTLINNGFQSDSIYYEYFGSNNSMSIELEKACNIEFVNSSLMVKSKPKNSSTLLDLAESSGLKPITGCRMGVCHQCKCKKNHGVVYNTLTNTYSDTGSEELQLCISMPVTDVSLNL